VFLVKKKVKLHVSDDTINYDLLTDEEKNL
jgi:hypothetical protein